MLNDARVRAAKPTEKAYKLYDERGLFLFVTPTGGRLWRLKYRIHGREKLISLGAYPDVALKRAREKRDEARKLVADGTDPSAVRFARLRLRERTRVRLCAIRIVLLKLYRHINRHNIMFIKELYI